MNPFTFEAAVEGILDEAVIRRSAAHLDMEVGNVYGQQGKSNIESSIRGFNEAAARWPWLVLVDLDDSHGCSADLRKEWLPSEAEFLCFRVAVHQVEAWVLADTNNAASLLGVKRSLLPSDPDSEPDAKKTLVEIARRSNREEVRASFAPQAGAKRKIGPLYNARLRAFIANRWDPDVAASRSDSLSRCLGALTDLRSKWEEANS